MNCQHIERRINELLDRRTAPRCDAVVSQHIAWCSSCEELLSDYESLLHGVDALAAHSQPLVELAERSPARPTRRRRRVLPALTTMAVAALLLLVVSSRDDNRGADEPKLASPAIEAAPVDDAVLIAEAPSEDASSPYDSLARGTGSMAGEIATRQMRWVEPVANGLRPMAAALGAVGRSLPLRSDEPAGSS